MPRSRPDAFLRSGSVERFASLAPWWPLPSNMVAWRPSGRLRGSGSLMTAKPASQAVARVLVALGERVVTGRRANGGWSARCPSHDDKRASLSVSEGEDGRALVHCYADCAAADVVAALGLTMAALMGRSGERPASSARANSEPKNGPGRIVAKYSYRDEQGAVLYQVVRSVPKGFRLRRPNGVGGWAWNLQDAQRVLYRLPELMAGRQDATVFVVEGEKDADALARLGLLATTNVGGAGKWRPEYGEALVGRHVAILPDNDEPGRRHADSVARMLGGTAASVRVVELSELPAKGDVSDWLERGGTAEALLDIVEKAPPYSKPEPSNDHEPPPPRDDDYPGAQDAAPEREHSRGSEASTHQRAAVAATVVTLATVEPREVNWLWPGRLPAGMVAVLDGQPGAGKSTLVIDLIARLTTGREFPNEEPGHSRTPTDVILIGNEDSPEHTIRPRLDAAGADSARVHLLTEIGGRLPRLPHDGVAIERVVREKGARLLAIDPLSAYIGEADLHRDNEVRAALAPLATIAERTGATVLMLRHLRKSGGTDAIGRGLGSVAIAALARAGLMLLVDPEDPTARILTWFKLSVARAPQSLRLRLRGAGDQPPRVEWLGVSDLTADALLASKDCRDRVGDREGDDATATNVAEAWLMSQLEASGTVPVSDLQRLAAEANISWRAVERAKARLGVRARRESVVGGHTGAGRWLLVAPATKAAKPDRLAALVDGDDSEVPNSPPNGDLEPRSKTANDQARQTTLAVFVDPADDSRSDS